MADTRNNPQVPRRDDAFLKDGVRVCPLQDNSTACECWWVVHGRPVRVAPNGACYCSPPPELWGRGKNR
jgi:hypothetical protein